MIGLLIAAIVLLVLALALLFRVFRGPTAADRIAALDPKDTAGTDEAVDVALGEKFAAALDNDLNTALGVTVLYDVLKAKTSPASKLALIGQFDVVLGLNLLEAAEKVRAAKPKAAAPAAAGEIVIFGEGDPAVDELVRQRQKARKEKNWAEADRIRDELAAMGVTVTDAKDGVHWTRN